MGWLLAAVLGVNDQTEQVASIPVLLRLVRFENGDGNRQVHFAFHETGSSGAG
jgi:hypothetical protein